MDDQQTPRYPRSVVVNFRQLEKASLTKVLKHYGVTPSSNASKIELACLAANVFEAVPFLEHEIVDKFASKYCKSLAEISNNGKKRINPSREQLDSEPARNGEQVAAKVSQDAGEEGSWILGNVLDFDPNQGMYEVQDEDDVNRIVHLPAASVKRLEDTSSHLRRVDRVLAVFPETTSFYPAVVAKNPKPPVSGSQWDVIVRFEGDEDDSGKAPPRKVPGRFVLKREYVDDDSSDDE